LAIGRLFTEVDRQFPGAVWSLSIGWGCDRLYTSADLQPVESALEKAESHGTSAFDATGDTAGLECKNNKDYSTPPSASDVGVDAISALPAMTGVGGTLISTDAQGHWAAEEAWDDSALSQGGTGGVSRLEARPSWQVGPGISSLRGAGHRLVPDVSADADPDSGVAVVIDGQSNKGGGTSQAAPIWAGFTVLMDDYLQHQGGHPIGALNPVVYRIAQADEQRAFHDITLGGDAVDFAKPGYDLVTGLGSPMIDNLVQDVLTLQRSGS
jgi:kumamolisin